MVNIDRSNLSQRPDCAGRLIRQGGSRPAFAGRIRLRRRDLVRKIKKPNWHQALIFIRRYLWNLIGKITVARPSLMIWFGTVFETKSLLAWYCRIDIFGKKLFNFVKLYQILFIVHVKVDLGNQTKNQFSRFLFLFCLIKRISFLLLKPSTNQGMCWPVQK